MQTVSIIGVGHVGRTLGYLLARSGFTIASLFGRNRETAQAGLDFIGHGSLALSLEAVEPADFLLVTTNDNALATIGADISDQCRLKPGSVAFHCSGATSSEVLAPLREQGVHVGSTHPVCSFPAPERDVRSFGGTWCGVEGDDTAVAGMERLFRAIGANPFRIDRDKKTLYHASMVMVCNYLVSLMAAGMEVSKAAGIAPDQIGPILEPFLKATLDNVFRLGPAGALTGPIARGDDAVVASQVEAVEALGQNYRALYAVLGGFTIDLAERKGTASAESVRRMRDLLGPSAARDATGA